MRNTLFIAVGLLFTLHVNAQFKSNTERLDNIKINVFGLFVGQSQFAYEKAINNHTSLQLSAGYIGGNSEVTAGNHKLERKGGFILIPEIRYYFNGNAPKGLYAAGLLRYRNVKQEFTDLNDAIDDKIDDELAVNLSHTKTNTAFGGGFVLGYQKVTKGGFVFDIFGGYTLKDKKSTRDYKIAELNKKSTNVEFDTKGDELFDSKFNDFDFSSFTRPFRFGINLGYAF